MAELTKNLHFLKNGTEQTAKIYTTASEAGNNYITVKGFAVQADNIETSAAKSELLNLMKNN